MNSAIQINLISADRPHFWILRCSFALCILIFELCCYFPPIFEFCIVVLRFIFLFFTYPLNPTPHTLALILPKIAEIATKIPVFSQNCPLLLTRISYLAYRISWIDTGYCIRNAYCVYRINHKGFKTRHTTYNIRYTLFHFFVIFSTFCRFFGFFQFLLFYCPVLNRELCRTAAVGRSLLCQFNYQRTA